MITELETTLHRKRRRMIQTTNLIVLVVVVLLGAFKLVSLGINDPPLPALAVAMLTLVNSWYIQQNGSLRNATWMIFGVLLLGLLFAAINSGAYSGATILLSPVLPVLAMLLMGSAAGWLAMILTGAILTLLFLMEFNGLILPNRHDPQGILISRFFAVTSTVFACTWIAWIFANHLRELVLLINNQANTDHLTGIPNRRALETAMIKETGRARRTNNWFSLVMLDVDHFKRYNDINGHPAGDRCLVLVAETIMKSARRPSDFIGRFGGEEFVVVLPDTDHAGACQVAEEIRNNMLKQQLHYDQNSLDCVSLTLGVVTIKGADLKSIDRLF